MQAARFVKRMRQYRIEIDAAEIRVLHRPSRVVRIPRDGIVKAVNAALGVSESIS